MRRQLNGSPGHWELRSLTTSTSSTGWMNERSRGINPELRAPRHSESLERSRPFSLTGTQTLIVTRRLVTNRTARITIGRGHWYAPGGVKSTRRYKRTRQWLAACVTLFRDAWTKMRVTCARTWSANVSEGSVIRINGLWILIRSPRDNPTVRGRRRYLFSCENIPSVTLRWMEDRDKFTITAREEGQGLKIS